MKNKWIALRYPVTHGLKILLYYSNSYNFIYNPIMSLSIKDSTHTKIEQSVENMERFGN